MKAQKYKPPETGNAEDNSLSARLTQMVSMLANTQPQTSTTGPPYKRPMPYSPAKHKEHLIMLPYQFLVLRHFTGFSFGTAWQDVSHYH